MMTTPTPQAQTPPTPGGGDFGSYLAAQQAGAAVPTVPGQGQTGLGSDPIAGDMAPTNQGLSQGAQQWWNTPVTTGVGLSVSRLQDAPDNAPAGVRTRGGMLQQLLDSSDSDPQSVINLQEELIQAGLLAPTAKVLNSLGTVLPNDPTYNVFKKIVDKAVDTGSSVEAVLSDAESSNPQRASSYWNQYQAFQREQQAAAQGATQPIKTERTTHVLTDPNAALQLVQNSLESHLGRRANPDEVAQFTSLLRGQEMAHPERESDTYGSAVAAGGYRLPTQVDTFSQRPDPAAMADAFARSSQGRANEVGQQNEIDFTKVLAGMMSGGRG